MVGIRYSDNPVISTEDIKNIWACSKIYNIPHISNNTDIQNLINSIEDEVFNLKDTNSLLFKANNSQWENDVQEELPDGSNSSPAGLRISFPKEGIVISNHIAIKAFIDALIHIKLERIPQIGIIHSGYNLVSKDKRPDGNWQREVNGWYIYSNINNETKCDDLDKISKALDLDLIIDSGFDLE